MLPLGRDVQRGQLQGAALYTYMMCVYVYVYICIYVYMYICMYIYLRVYTYIYIYIVSVCVYIYIYICIHMPGIFRHRLNGYLARRVPSLFSRKQCLEMLTL